MPFRSKILCNSLALAGLAILGINPLSSLNSQIFVAMLLISAAALMWVKGKRSHLALLVFLVLQYPLSALLG